MDYPIALSPENLESIGRLFPSTWLPINRRPIAGVRRVAPSWLFIYPVCDKGGKKDATTLACCIGNWQTVVKPARGLGLKRRCVPSAPGRLDSAKRVRATRISTGCCSNHSANCRMPINQNWRGVWKPIPSSLKGTTSKRVSNRWWPSEMLRGWMSGWSKRLCQDWHRFGL